MSSDVDTAQNALSYNSSQNLPEIDIVLKEESPLKESRKTNSKCARNSESDKKTIFSVEENEVKAVEDRNMKIIAKSAKKVKFDLEPDDGKGTVEEKNLDRKTITRSIKKVKFELEEPETQAASDAAVVTEKESDTRGSTKLKLDLQSMEKVDAIQQSSPEGKNLDLKSELVVSLEKLNSSGAKTRTTSESSQEDVGEKIEVTLLSGKSPVQEKSSDSEKNVPNQAKDATQVRTSARVNKRKLEQEQDRKILGNSPPYFRPDDEGILTDHPLDQVFGSVISTNLNEDSRSPQVRTSARVIKKMRLEAVAPSTSKSEPVEKKDKKDDPKPESRQKAVRPWIPEEKTMFFEAVSEYGKDFESIYSYIHTKLKKRGVPDDQNKTKDQVCRFYYKIFHEVSRHVKFSDKIRKVVQELYAIINYGELYKKLGVFNEKSCVKLAEMIYRGSTLIKHKGRTLRVKTPMCRALRKLNQLEDNYEELQLPNRVTVEIRPKDMAAYYRIQSMAQNPRLRTALPLQKRLDTLLVCLNKRWKTYDAANYEKIYSSSDPVTNELIENRPQMPEEKEVLIPPLRLSPPVDAKIELPSINLSEYLTRQTICLTAFEARLGLDTYSELQLKKKALKPKSEVEQKCTVIGDKDISLNKDENEINSSTETEPDVQVSDSVDSAINTILSLRQKIDRQDSEQSESEEIQPSMTGFIKEGRKDVKEEKTLVLDHEVIAKIDKIKKGWTEADCGSLTMGELYLMYGADSKLILEYSWDIKEETKSDVNSSAHFLERWSEFFDDYAEEHCNLSYSLSKLLSIAKLHYRRNIIKCPCGHVCSEKSSQNSKHNPLNMASTSTPRLRKMSLENASAKDESDTPGTNNPGIHNLMEDSIHIRDNMLEQENMFEDSEMISFARKPMYIPSKSSVPLPTMEQQLDSIQKLKPKYCNRKGRRPRSKQVVVERKLPLLPNNIESGHQIVRMNIISQEPVPEAPPLEKVVGQLEENAMSEENEDEEGQSEDHKSVDRVNDSPPLMNTGTTSPSGILKEGEWMASDVADYSLSSLLGHLESPVKTSTVTNTGTDLSNQLDAHLRSLMTQNSLDFAASFAELARVTCEDNALKKDG